MANINIKKTAKAKSAAQKKTRNPEFIYNTNIQFVWLLKIEVDLYKSGNLLCGQRHWKALLRIGLYHAWINVQAIQTRFSRASRWREGAIFMPVIRLLKCFKIEIIMIVL